MQTAKPSGGTVIVGALFGWNTCTQETPSGPYSMFSADGTDLGGRVEMNEEWGEMPAAWTPYFGVTDLDAALEQIPSLCVEVAKGPLEAEGGGRFAVMHNPQSAFLSIIQLDTSG